MQRKEKIQALTMVAGLLLTVAIVCSNVLLLSQKFHQVAEVKSEKAQDEKEIVALTAAPTTTPPSSFHVQMKVEAHCLFEVILDNERNEEFISEFAFHPGKLVLTLFRVIISPNAP